MKEFEKDAEKLQKAIADVLNISKALLSERKSMQSTIDRLEHEKASLKTRIQLLEKQFRELKECKK